jgi:hypothetical protein
MKHIFRKALSTPGLISGLDASSFSPQTERRPRGGFGFSSLARACSLIGAAILAGLSASPAQAQDAAGAQLTDAGNSDAYATTVDYVVQFYPLWFSYKQLQVNNRLGATNRLVAPAKVSPNFKFVVASNYDTLYSSSFLDLSTEPVLVTVPATKVGYSTLVLDAYGNQIPAAIPQTPDVFAFTGPGFSGTLPDGVTEIKMPINYPLLNWRMVKFSPTGEDQTTEAEAFRASIKEQTLSGYLRNPSQGRTLIVPEFFFTTSFKTTADNLIADQPTQFLKQLQKAVKLPTNPPLTSDQQKLSDHFDELFGDGDTHRGDFSAGAQKAHELIVDNYLTHTGPTSWIHFTNIATWSDDAVLDRAGISEYLQQSNAITTAAYYHTFSSGNGRPLDGTDPDGYVLTFPAGQLPDARLFWSLTAYTPDAIELVSNCADKYVVASYTPGLTYNGDGSLTIYLSKKPPAQELIGNWLPIPEGKFNILLRVYGPQGSVEDNTYVPPGIERK